MNEQIHAQDGAPVKNWAASPANMHMRPAQLARRILALEVCSNQASQNSSKPLSCNQLGATARPPRVSCKHICGVPLSHRGGTRGRRKPNQIASLPLAICPQCAMVSQPTVPSAVPPCVTNLWDVSPVTPSIIGSVRRTACDPTRVPRMTADLPLKAATGSGPPAAGLAGRPLHTYHPSYRTIGDCLSDTTNPAIEPGTIGASIQRVDQVVAPLDTAVHMPTQALRVINVDEAGWLGTRQRRWCWTGVTAQPTSARITASREHTGLDVVISAKCGGTTGSGCWPATRPYTAHQQYTMLTNLNYTFIRSICEYLEISTKISFSWDYSIPNTDNRTERLKFIVSAANGTEYVSGPSAKQYMEESVFLDEDISISWFDYDNYKVYPQLWGEFTHTVTILDLLFNCGKNSYKYMKYVSKPPL
jgi:hypothetical protein